MIKAVQKFRAGASLVARWLGVHLPVQGAWVRALVREDPACRGAAEPVRHGCLSLRPGACEPQRLRPACLEPVLRSKRGHLTERPAHRHHNNKRVAPSRGSPRTATETQHSQK